MNPGICLDFYFTRLPKPPATFALGKRWSSLRSFACFKNEQAPFCALRSAKSSYPHQSKYPGFISDFYFGMKCLEPTRDEGNAKIKEMKKQRYEVIVKTELADTPKEHELSAAIILAYHFKTNVTFLRPEARKTPDIDVSGTMWEIKSPMGNGKKTIDNNLRAGRKQSHFIVLDLRRAKLHQSKALAHIRHYLTSGPHTIRGLKVITKTGEIIDIL
jgi:hypothetical protein